MGPLTFDDVLVRWDPAAIQAVFRVAIKRAETLGILEESLQHTQVSMRADWVGEAGLTFHDAMRKILLDIEADRRESLRAAAAVGHAEKDVSRFRAEAQRIQASADANHWTITPDWEIDVGDTPVQRSLVEFVVSDAMLRILQNQLDELQVEADQADEELATAMRAAVGETQLRDTGHPTPEHHRPAPHTNKPTGPIHPKPVAPGQVSHSTHAHHERPAPHTDKHTGPVHPKPIALSQVSYSGMGKWGSGEKATRRYINQALDAMGITNPTARANWMTGMLTLVGRESGFNSKSGQVNTWDSNAQASTYTLADGYGNMDSRGAAQCIPPTFAANHQPGTSDSIYNPVANIAADMNHLMSTYGVSRNGSNLAAKVAQANPNAAPEGQ
jgi:hypothetical protein